MIREALLEMGKGHLIGNGPDCLVPPEGRGELKGKSGAERSRSKGLKPALTRYSAITHQRSNGAGNKAERSEAGAGNAPAASDRLDDIPDWESDRKKKATIWSPF